MNHTCLLMGHDFNKWIWNGGRSSSWVNGVTLGPTHDEKRNCVRCGFMEHKKYLDGKYNNMTEDQMAGLEKSIAAGLVKEW